MPPKVGVAPARGPDVDAVIRAVLAAKRYRYLSPQFVDRVARDASRHARRTRDAEDETKRRLHQVFGAYVNDLPVERFIAELENAAGQPESLRETARRLMHAHASTRERLSILDTFYAEIFAVTGAPRRVVDIACGFGPLALPWMALPAGSSYHAYDVDARYVALAEACLRVFATAGSAELCDVAVSPPPEPADVALVLKSIPCLEQQATGSAERLLRTVLARHVVVSFPTRSLGGAHKGMIATYRATMERLCEGRDWHVSELLFPVELVFIVDKHGV